MQEIMCVKFGSADVLELKEVEKLEPGNDEVLVRNYASSINSAYIMYQRKSRVVISIEHETKQTEEVFQ